ncbi:MAG: signal peptidase I [Gammaproteobacteria bacterium]|nr:signal peptidase I [Gammaproteobacteria bacterium]
MQSTLILAFFALLVWVVIAFGIEQALALATIVSGVVWFGYRLAKGKPDDEQKIPTTVEYARSFFPIFLIVLLLRAFLVEPFRIPSGSMMPTLLVGDFILVNKYAYGIRMPVTKTKLIDVGEPQRGDIVVFRWPVNPRLDYIKRVVGLPGDRVRYQNKTLFINGEPQTAEVIGPYQPEGSGMRAIGSIEAREKLGEVEHSILVNPLAADFSPSCGFLGYREVTVPEGKYLMVGDNRDDSNDGRCWGFVPEENLVGKAFFVWLSWDWQRSGFIALSRIGGIGND